MTGKKWRVMPQTCAKFISVQACIAKIILRTEVFETEGTLIMIFDFAL